MTSSGNFLTPTQFARPLRAAAVFIAVASAVWELGDFLSGAPEIASLVAARALVVIVATAIAIASTPRRSVAALRWLTVALATAALLGNLLVMVIDPDQTWPSLAVQIAITLGTALFIPWSWRWQAALAGSLTVVALAAIVVWVPRSAFGLQDLGLATVTLLAVTAASALGADLADRERLRVLDSEALHRALFESAGAAIAVLDEGGVIRQANVRLATLLGRPLENIVGRTLESFHAGAARGGVTPSTEHLEALSGQLQRGTHTFAHADGRQIEVDISYARTAGTVTPQVQAILHDLTERRALQRSEVKDQRLDALAQLAGGIAHQFNNVLGGILTHAGVLREDAANSAAAAELDEIIGAARRGRELTQELLRFTKSAPLSLQPTAPGLLLESVAALARSSLPDDIAIEVRAAPDLPPLQGDVDHLVHACLELVLNARDAMQGVLGGKLTLTAAVEEVAPDDNRWPGAAPGRYVRLAVGDNGRGMDAATRDRAFEPFFTTKPMHRAAGIGLPKVHGVVRDHHGAIRVDSTPGRGTTVHVLIPVAKGAVAEAPAALARPAVLAAPATILVVDDEAIVRHSLRRALTKFGYRVLEAGDGPSALAELQGANPPVSLVILDLVLPGGGAGILELLRAIRPDLKVLVSSGYSPEAETVKDLVRRVEGFLPKPYEMSELRTAVTRALAS
jgi:PAS domain S-box-containing protein